MVSPLLLSSVSQSLSCFSCSPNRGTAEMSWKVPNGTYDAAVLARMHVGGFKRPRPVSFTSSNNQALGRVLHCPSAGHVCWDGVNGVMVVSGPGDWHQENKTNQSQLGGEQDL